MLHKREVLSFKLVIENEKKFLQNYLFFWRKGNLKIIQSKGLNYFTRENLEVMRGNPNEQKLFGGEKTQMIKHVLGKNRAMDE